MSQVAEKQQSTQQNSNEILLIPFAKVGDHYNLQDNVLISIWNKIIAQKLLNKVFYDGSITSAKQFVDMMKHPSNLPVIAYNGEILGFGWLNDMAKNRALAHFCMFREAWGKHTLEIGHKFLDYWFSLEQNGEPLFRVLVGNTPPWNKPAVSFIQRLGFKIVGEIPYVGMISYIEGDDHGKQEWTEGISSEQGAG